MLSCSLVVMLSKGVDLGMDSKVISLAILRKDPQCVFRPNLVPTDVETIPTPMLLSFSE